MKQIALHYDATAAAARADPGSATEPAAAPSIEDLAQEAAAAQAASAPSDIHDWLQYPRPRGEVLKECLFVALPVAGAILAMLLPAGERSSSTTGLIIHVLGGALCGYFVGAALIWGTRILGTLGFGKEAMGLGDVHLLGAIGAVLGPKDTALVFFIAPFIGLLYALGALGARAVLKVRHHPIPYGPHLAIAAFLMILFRVPIISFIRSVF